MSTDIKNIQKNFIDAYIEYIQTILDEYKKDHKNILPPLLHLHFKKTLYETNTFSIGEIFLKNIIGKQKEIYEKTGYYINYSYNDSNSNINCLWPYNKLNISDCESVLFSIYIIINHNKSPQLSGIKRKSAQS